MTTIPMHTRAIDWALSKGWLISVTDLCCDDDEWDLEYSSDRDACHDAASATDIPNVHLFTAEREHIMTFSVIDEGVPDETINDYTIARDDAPEWKKKACDEWDQWWNKAVDDYE